MRGGAGRRDLVAVLATGAVLLAACARTTSTEGMTGRSTVAPPVPSLVPVIAPSADPPSQAVDGGPPTTARIAVDDGSTTTASPSPTTSSPARRRPIRLVFTGDVLMHSPLWRQALANGGGVHDFAPMFDHVRPIVETADLAVCHLETPVAPPFEPYSTSPRYGVPAEVVDGLAAAGFDHCSTASNHTFDRGVRGLEATVERFRQQGLTQHGMAVSPSEIEPILLEVGGVRIGHVSATYGYDGANPPRDEPWRSNLIDLDRLLADAQWARDRGAEVVILSLHWGNSSSHRPTDAQRRIAEALQASGLVDLVIGHHAHVVQPVEEIGEMWVAWGLGNFVSNMPLAEGPFPDEATRDGLLLEVVLTPQPDGTVPVTQVVARPIWVDRDAGWVVRDVATALQEPDLVARVGRDLTASWERTGRFVPWLLPPAPVPPT